MTATEARALLASLIAQHGDSVVASLLGAAFAADAEQNQTEAKANGEELGTWDLGYFVAYTDTPAFVEAAGDAYRHLNTDSCEY